MAFIFSFLSLLCSLYLLVLVARVIFDLIVMFSRQWRPQGVILVLANAVYSLTDPPLRFLARFIPPVRMGTVALDVGFLVLFFGVQILQRLIMMCAQFFL